MSNREISDLVWLVTLIYFVILPAIIAVAYGWQMVDEWRQRRRIRKILGRDR